MTYMPEMRTLIVPNVIPPAVDAKPVAPTMSYAEMCQMERKATSKRDGTNGWQCAGTNRTNALRQKKGEHFAQRLYESIKANPGQGSKFHVAALQSSASSVRDAITLLNKTGRPITMKIKRTRRYWVA